MELLMFYRISMGLVRVSLPTQYLWIKVGYWIIHWYNLIASQKECAVCMSENKDTIVLPCRHLCLCNTCANLLRMQDRVDETSPTLQAPPKCPICRQVFHSLISVSLPAPYAQYPARGSRNSVVPSASAIGWCFNLCSFNQIICN